MQTICGNVRKEYISTIQICTPEYYVSFLFQLCKNRRLSSTNFAITQSGKFSKRRTKCYGNFLFFTSLSIFYNLLETIIIILTILLILKIMAIVHSRQSRVSFDTSWLEDLYEQVILETQANKVLPLVINPGRVLLTSSRIYFQPYNNMDQVNIDLYYEITKNFCNYLFF